MFALFGMVILGVMATFALLPPHLRPWDTAQPTVPLAVGTLLAAATFLVPWDRLSDTAVDRVLRTLLLIGAAALSWLVAATGGAESDVLWSVMLIILLAVAVCGPLEQLMLFAVTAVGYVVAAAATDTLVLSTVAFRLGTLATIALGAGYLSSLLRKALWEIQRAREQAEYHAALLHTVAEGMRAASATDPDDVLQAVSSTLLDLGWERVDLYTIDDDRLVVAHASDGADDPWRGDRPSTVAFARAAVDAEIPLLAPDAADEPALSAAARDHGLRTAMAAPFRAHGEIAGVVVAATSAARRSSRTDFEIFELVAASAGRALELARRYALETERVVELGQLDRLRSEFLSTVSHELRTPLTVILGLSETLDRMWDGMDEPQRRQLLDRVRSNADGLDRVITRLLDFSRLEQGRLETRFETFDLVDLVRQVAQRLGHLLASHEVVLDTPASCEVHGDAQLIERVIENLLSNAQRHTPAGTVVEVSVRPSGAHVDVEVTDHGPGIAADELPRLGERFYRAGEARALATRGMGLGLALSQEVLRLHDSQLAVTSELGKGTTFRFSLPAVAPAPALSGARGTHAPGR